MFLIVTGCWLMILSVLAATGYFTVTNTLPPRFFLVILIPIIGIVLFFSTRWGRRFIDRFDMAQLTVLHSIRIFIEMVLFWLFLTKLMPQLMTFEGRNFDIISGLTAPLVYYFGFVKRTLGAKTLIAWNFLCLFILLFTVGNAILSAPTPFQKLGFDQPTVAVLYFPFVWLPGIVVPLVIFSHLISIRLLLKQIRQRHVPSALAV